MASTYVTQAEAIIHAKVEGVDHLPKIKTWQSYEGGDAQASTTQILPGGMQPAVAAPGPIKRTNVTVKRPYTVELHPHVPHLEGAINNRMHVSYIPTDANGNPLAAAVTRTGILRNVQPPSFDSKGTEEAVLALVMECDT